MSLDDSLIEDGDAGTSHRRYYQLQDISICRVTAYQDVLGVDNQGLLACWGLIKERSSILCSLQTMIDGWYMKAG